MVTRIRLKSQSARLSVKIRLFDLSFLFVMTSQWGILSQMKWEAKARGRLRKGSGNLVAMAAPMIACAVAVIILRFEEREFKYSSLGQATQKNLQFTIYKLQLMLWLYLKVRGIRSLKF